MFCSLAIEPLVAHWSRIVRSTQIAPVRRISEGHARFAQNDLISKGYARNAFSIEGSSVSQAGAKPSGGAAGSPAVTGVTSPTRRGSAP